MTNGRWLYKIHQASPAELDDVVRLIEQRQQWLRDQGSDQWSVERTPLRERMAANIDRGRTWLLTNLARRPLGTITVFREADPDFWTPSEAAVPALYLARLASDPASRGAGIGSVMLRWSLNKAFRNHLAEVRFDAWKTSAGLHRYYQQQGWTYLRTVDRPGRFSGALFARPAEPVRIPELLWTDNPEHDEQGVAGWTP
jgi:GNAT superfamily N-acetyltransferase